MTPPRPGPAAPLGPLALYAALATLFCAPVLADPTGLALGHPANDVWNHLWGFWWVAEELTEGRIPLTTELLSWPNGGTLWFIDTFNAVLTLPVTLLAGPVAAYNAAIWLNLVLCGLGAYALALRVTRSHPGATLAGLAFLSTPHFLGQTYNGISETLSAGWLPLALTTFLAARAAPTRKSAAVAGVALGVCVVANWYYGLFAGLVLGAVLAWDAIGAVRARTIAPAARRAVPLLVAGGAATAALVVGPFSLFYASMGAEDAVVTRDPAFVWMTLVMHNMTDLVSLLRPGRVYSPDLKAMFDEDLLVVVYLGHALLWPALLVLGTGWRRLARPWALFFAAFTLLSLGPFLYVAGAYVSVDGGWIPLPFLGLFEAFPLFSRISHAYRFVVGASLALSVLVAWTVRALAERGVSPWLAVGWIGGLRLVETLWLSQAPFPLPVSEATIPAAYARLDGGALLDLPVSMPVLARSRYSWYQLAHLGPMPYGLNDPSPTYLYLNRYTRYLIELERSTVAYLPAALPFLDLALGQEDLVSRGLTWIVVHRDQYPTNQYPKVEQFLDLTATPVWDDGDTRVYRLSPDVSGR